MTLEETENARIREEHAELLREKVKREQEWHEEVRRTLTDHGEKLVAIKSKIDGLPNETTRIEKLEDRVKTLENFKLQAVAWWSAGSVVVLVAWKIIEKFWK